MKLEQGFLVAAGCQYWMRQWQRSWVPGNQRYRCRCFSSMFYCMLLAIVVPCSIIILQVISVYCHLCTSLLESPPTKDKIQAHTQQRWFYDCQCRHRSLLRQKDRGSLRKAASPSQTFKSVSPKQTHPLFKSAHSESHWSPQEISGEVNTEWPFSGFP